MRHRRRNSIPHQPYHVKKYIALDLLKEIKRDDGKVFYQRVAGVFKYDRRIVPACDVNNATVKELKNIEKRFLEAYERSDRLAENDDPDYSHVIFRTPDGHKDDILPRTDYEKVEPRPAHIEIYTAALSPERYKELVAQISALLQEAAEEAKDADEHSEKSSFAFLAFDDPAVKSKGMWSMTSSFIPNIR